MSDFDIKVVGVPSPRKPEGPLKRLLRRVGRVCKALLMRPRVVFFGALAVLVLSVGTPHIGSDYECRVPLRPGKPCPAYFYCGYYGVQGRRVLFPEYGETCSLIEFLPIDWTRIG